MSREKAQKDFAEPLLAPFITIRALKMYFIHFIHSRKPPNFSRKTHDCKQMRSFSRRAETTKSLRGSIVPLQLNLQHEEFSLCCLLISFECSNFHVILSCLASLCGLLGCHVMGCFPLTFWLGWCKVLNVSSHICQLLS